jgi:hypothetical protein
MGYLSESMYGYALAAFAWMREDPKPRGSKYLAGNVDHYRKWCMKYLSQMDGLGLPKLDGA